MPLDQATLDARVREIVGKRKTDEVSAPEPVKRPRKSKVEKVAEDTEIAQMEIVQAAQAIAPTIHALWAPFINRWTPDKPYGEMEALHLSIAIVGVSRKYPESFKYKEEMALLLVVGAQFGGRYMSARMEANESSVSTAPETSVTPDMGAGHGD